MFNPHRTLLIALNLIVIAIALYGFVILATSSLPNSEHSPNEIHQKLAAIPDANHLRRIIERDDSYIRSLEEIVAKFTTGSKWILIFFGTCGGFNIALLLKRPSPDQETERRAPMT